MDRTKRIKTAIIVSHPIQYFAPLYRRMAKHPRIDLTVFYFAKWGLQPTLDPGFGKVISWDIPLLDGYKYKFLPNRSPWRKRPDVLGSFNPSIASELVKGRFDTVIIHGHNGFNQLYALWRLRKSKTITFMTGDGNILLEGDKPAWKIRLKRVLLPKIYSMVDGFLSNGKNNRRYYEYYGVSPEKIFFAPILCVDNERFMKTAEKWRHRKRELRRRLGLPPDKVVFIFSGKLVPRKRPVTLLRAYQLAKPEIQKNAFLVFVGDGPNRAEIESSDVSNILVAGFINQQQIPLYYAAADVLVFPSYYDLFPLSVNEAMCAALPVVLSDRVGWAGELVQDGVNGLIFPCDDVKALAKAIETLVKDPRKRERMGQESLRIVQKYSYDRFIEGFIDAYETLKTRKRS